MEPDVIRMYSASPPPMEDGAEEEDDEFGDFGTFSSVPNSTSLSEFETPTTFNQTQALTATSPPELLASKGMVDFSRGTSNGICTPGNELSKVNGVGPMNHPDSSDRTESRKPVSCSLDSSVSSEPAECNGGDTEVLTNGFVTFDLQGSPSSQNSVHSQIEGLSSEETGSIPVGSSEDEFADFSAFSNTEGHLTAQKDGPTAHTLPLETAVHNQGTEDTVRDTNRTRAETLDGSGTTNSLQRDGAFTVECSQTDGTKDDLVLMDKSKETIRSGETDFSSDAAADSEVAQMDEKSSETETETSFGRLLSTEALEEYGDTSLTGSVPSLPPQGDTSSPADEDEDFGDFGDNGSFMGQDFSGFEVQQDQNFLQGSGPAQEVIDMEQEDDFGDFSSPRLDSGGDEGEDRGQFPASDSFGNFSSAAGGEDGSGWSAFGEQHETEGESWAAFSTELSVAPPAEEEKQQEEEEEEEWHEGASPAVSEHMDKTEGQTALLSSRLEKLFHCSFPQSSVQNELAEDRDHVVTLKVLLEPAEDGAKPEDEEAARSPCSRSALGSVLLQLQDVHEAVGLRYQWGGSHCNKALLCCLGIDTRNILFTGQKKQPVIVPMYAAGLGMLEPTKEPVKPVSAAEMIASIAQTPPAAPEKSSCHSDSVQQEVLPPVQFDWSSSGLTNPLDTSGGSALLNLDFFGPVEDSGSGSSASIPGVDPELFELTTSKLDPGVTGSRVADAFARLMSTMDKTSTSTRKLRKDENLSEEAAKVITALPDLSFMQAKVLMFPATLTPLNSQAAAD